MKVKHSEYLLSVKPLLRKLTDCLNREYESATLLAADVTMKSWRVARTGITIQNSEMFGKRGFVAKIFDGKGFFEYSFNQISEENLDSILSTIREKHKEVSYDRISYDTPTDPSYILDKSTDYEIDPEELGNEKIIEHLSHIREKALAFSPHIIDCSTTCQYQKYTKIFLSPNRDMIQSSMWTICNFTVMAAESEEIKDYYKSFSNLGGAEVLQSMEEKIEEGAQTAIELLNSLPIPPGEYDCICTPDVTGMIVHEAFGHGVEMDMYVKNRALAQKFTNQYVASPLVTMHDGAAAANEVATYFFDDDGNLSTDTIVIDKGILKNGICDMQSAMLLGISPTGNGRRESIERKTYTRMTNTYFEAGTSTPEEMIASISYGFLLDNPTSGMEDPKNWGIQCMVNFAREIKDGKLTGRLFSPIVLTGYVPTLLKSITMVGNTVELAGGGGCGKGYKEWVKVSDGGPYIKAKIRLG